MATKKKTAKGLTDKELIDKYNKGGKTDFNKGLKAMVKSNRSKKK